MHAPPTIESKASLPYRDVFPQTHADGLSYSRPLYHNTVPWVVLASIQGLPRAHCPLV